MSIIPLFALLASAVPVVTAPAPPPPPVAMPMIVTPPVMRRNGPRTTETIAVQFRQDGRLLWGGEMTRASDGVASFSQQLRESLACPMDDASQPRLGRLTPRNTSFSITISPDYGSENGVRVSIERSRPYGTTDGAGCGDSSGSSTVRFDSRTALPVGKPVTLTGEGGLSVTLTRR